MGRQFDQLDDDLRRWLAAQPLFFVGTAPSDLDGHINISPKGGTGAFAVLGPRQVAYLDLIGSGIETAAHLRENGRIVLMFCAFAGPPKIVRLHGRGRYVPADAPEFAALLDRFAPDEAVRPLARGAVAVAVERIADSCGFGVPRMSFEAERTQLVRWAENRRTKQGDGWKTAYSKQKNAVSIDELPGLDVDD